MTRSSAEGQAASALLRVELEKYGCGFPVDVISTIRNQHVALQVWPCAYLHVHALNTKTRSALQGLITGRRRGVPPEWSW